MKKISILSGILLAQWFGLGVIAYIVGRPHIRWRTVFYELLIAIPLIVIFSGAARWRYRHGNIKKYYWFLVLQLCALVLIHPFIAMIRPRASVSELVALLVSSILVILAPLAVMAYYEQRQEDGVG